MVVGDTAGEAYTEFAAAAAERRAKGGDGAVKGAKKAQRPPTNTDGAPPALKVSNPTESTPWLINSTVKPNNGIVPAAKPESLAVAASKLGGVPTRFNTIRSGSGSTDSGGYLSRAASLAPPREGPSRGMSISRSVSPGAPGRAPSVSPARGLLDPAELDAGFDDILGDYGDRDESPRRKPTMIGAGTTRALSTKAPMSSYSGLNATRGLQRQITMGSTYSRGFRAISVYDEDGEMPLRLIKVKVRNARVTAIIYPVHPLTPPLRL